MTERLHFTHFTHSYFITGEGNGNPLQYFFLENPMDRGAWRAMVHGVAELDTTEVKKQASKWVFKMEMFQRADSSRLSW